LSGTFSGVAKQLNLAGTAFVWAARIDPDRDASGRPIELMPQDRYSKASTTPLNPNGAGPFCRFTVADLPTSPGVYALTVDGDVAYVGKGQNLSERWGPRGYAAIHPRNCFVGGQSTNCKVNHRILLAARSNAAIELWIHVTEQHAALESSLIRSLDPLWNSQVPL
jgi:hypothetical protein